MAHAASSIKVECGAIIKTQLDALLLKGENIKKSRLTIPLGILEIWTLSAGVLSVKFLSSQ
jgi:hypothetical protein